MANLNNYKDVLEFDTFALQRGLYFLLDEKYKVVYIGKTECLAYRIGSRELDKNDAKKFRNHYHYVRCMPMNHVCKEDLAALEKALIRKFKPRYNATHNNGKPLTKFENILIDTFCKGEVTGYVNHGCTFNDIEHLL